MNTLDLAQKKVKLKKVSETNGGEWQGPCPSCGGEDRFHVWPNQNETKGAYWCRGCGKTGDNIQFLRDFDGMSFRDACAELNIDLPDRPDHEVGQPNPPPQYTKPAFKPTAYASPADLWQEKAEKFVTWAQNDLLENASALAWLAARGINAETTRNFRLGWNPGEPATATRPENDLYRPRKSWGLPEILKDDGRPKMLWIPRGLVIPYILDGFIYRIRIRRPECEPRYYVLPGSSMATMIIEPARRAFVIVESELDAIAVASANTLAGAVGLGSASTKPDAEAFAILSESLQILNALDYDAAGTKAIAWWEEQLAEQCDRWPTPKGKDPGEAVQMGTDLKEWITRGLRKFAPALTIGEGKRASDSAMARPLVSTTKAAVPLKVPVGTLLPDTVRELLDIRGRNPGVKIINTAERYTVLRNGKFVGGRINELVFRTPEVLAYISANPAAEIDAQNLIFKPE